MLSPYSDELNIFLIFFVGISIFIILIYAFRYVTSHLFKNLKKEPPTATANQKKSTYADLLFWIVWLILDSISIWSKSLSIQGLAAVGMVVVASLFLITRKSIIAKNNWLGKELSLGVRWALWGIFLVISLVTLPQVWTPQDPLIMFCIFLVICLAIIGTANLIIQSKKK